VDRGKDISGLFSRGLQDIFLSNDRWSGSSLKEFVPPRGSQSCSVICWHGKS
jgi:hypothetical protein